MGDFLPIVLDEMKEKRSNSWKRPLILLLSGLVLVVLFALAMPPIPPSMLPKLRLICINNLREFDQAKEKWALFGRYTTGAKPSEKDIAKFMTVEMPVCPQGCVYEIGAIGENPTCSIESHTLSPVTSVVALIPLGTNTPAPNTTLYDPIRRCALGLVCNAENRHEFGDGTDGAGVLLLDLNGLLAWVPQANLAKSLVIQQNDPASGLR